jgi:hypothetical protein
VLPRDRKVDGDDDWRILRQETAQALTDAEFRASGGTIVYAVDSSEIHAFVYPLSTADELGLPGLTAPWRMGLHSALLEQLFFRQGQLLLLQPYLHELRAIADSIGDREIRRCEQVLDNALAEAGKLREHPIIQSLLEKVRANDGLALADDQRESIMKLLAKQFPALLLLARREEWNPFARLAQLLDHTSFIDLEQLGIPLTRRQLNEHLVTAIGHSLAKQRRYGREAESRFDAWALAFLHAANEELAKKHTRIVLVTRSSAMVRAMGELADGNKLDLDFSHIRLRSPTAFLLTALWGGDLPGDPSGVLEGRLGGLDGLLLPGEHLQPSARPHHLHETAAVWRGAPQPILQQFNQDWSELQTIALFKQIAQAEKPDASSDDEIARVLSFLADDVGLQSVIYDRLEIASVELRRSAAKQLDSIPGIGTEPIGFERRPPPTRSKDRPFVLRQVLGRQPFSLQFFSVDLEGLLKDRKLTTKMAYARLLTRSQSVCAYERRLAFAYLVAMQHGRDEGKWDLARTYCDLALAAPRLDGEPERHEGLYFRALCQRMAGRLTPTNVRLSLANLEDATRLSRKTRSDPTFEDPRYLSERGAQIHNFWTSLHGKPAPLGFPPLAEALECWRRGIELVGGNDPWLRLTLLNNLTYHHVEHAPDESETALELFNELRKQIDAMGLQGEAKLPGRFLHTVVWARFRLRHQLGTDPDKLLQEVLTELEQLRQALDLTDQHRRRLDEQISEVKAELEA